MRSFVTLILVLSMLFLPAAGLAQAPAAQPAPATDNTVVVVDPDKDVMMTVAPRLSGPSQNASALSEGSFQHLDVRKIVFGQETDDSFQITVQFTSLTSSLPTGTGNRAVYFAYGRVNWRVAPGNCNQGRNVQTSTAPTTGCLSGNGAGQRGFKPVEWQVDPSTNSWTFTIPKDAIFNENRVPARFGDTLTNITASTSQSFGTPWGGGGDITGGAYAYDRAPNTGFGPEFTFIKGANGRGFLALESMEPIRVSNGEATTIVYKVEVTNTNTEPMSVGLESLVDKKYLDQGWTVRVPSLLQLEGKQTLQFPVILALPFSHKHGETALFKVAARSLEDTNSYAETELGVFWTDVPQPSAHHEGEDSGTWFHSKPAEGDFPPQQVRDQLFPVMELWMNGVPDDPDPEATDRNVPAFFNDGLGCARNFLQGCTVPPTWQASWQVPLSPGLLLGLDFDLSRQGKMTFDILPKVPASAAKVRVQLEYCDPTQQVGGGGRGGGFGNETCYQYRTVLAQGEQTVALSANQVAHFEVPLAIDPNADLIPYRKGHNIRLQIFLITTDVPQNLFGTEPRPEFVTDKALLQLPLIEYHDPIDQAFQNVGTLALESQSPFEKLVNPGKTTLFHFNVVSTGKQAQPIQLELQGVNAAWARLVGPTEFDLPAGGRRNVTIAVTAPDEAQPEERAELFFVAQHQADQSVVAVTRLRASVVMSPEIDDEAGLLASEEESDTPGLAIAGALGALAIGSVMVRNRRRADR